MPKKPVIFAHRGSRLLNPENTILAFQNAVDFGADVVETDVQLTKDGKLVIFHDGMSKMLSNITILISVSDTVDRVTNTVGKFIRDFSIIGILINM